MTAILVGSPLKGEYFAPGPPRKFPPLFKKEQGWDPRPLSFVGTAEVLVQIVLGLGRAHKSGMARCLLNVRFSAWRHAVEMPTGLSRGWKQTFAKMTHAKKKDRLAAVLRNPIECLDQAAVRLAFSTSRRPAIASSTATLACSIDATA
jgi:hypothetical protein